MKKYNCNVTVRKDLQNESEARRAFAVKKAKNDIVMWLESDNIFQDKNALEELVQPFINDPKIIATFSLHYAYTQHGSSLDKYCALFGTSDPVALYLNKTDRETWLTNDYTKGNIIQRNKNYDTVEFDRHSLPTVGDNGFLINRKVLLKAQVNPDEYFHIDVFVDLLQLGFNRFGVVKSTAIEHVIGNSFLKLARRRIMYMERFDPQVLTKRRYMVYDSSSMQDKKNLILYLIYAATFIQPLIMSVRGYQKIKDPAWFFHPFVCFLFLIAYGKVNISNFVKNKLKNI
jgi:GT2 family glycosyltransferase